MNTPWSFLPYSPTVEALHNPSHIHGSRIPSPAEPSQEQVVPMERRGARVSSEPSSWGTNAGRQEGTKAGTQKAGLGEAWGEVSTSVKEKWQHLGPQWPDEAALRGGKEEVAWPPVRAPQSHCERTPRLGSQACPDPPSSTSQPPLPLLKAGAWKAAATGKSSQKVGWKMVSGPRLHPSTLLPPGSALRKGLNLGLTEP